MAGMKKPRRGKSQARLFTALVVLLVAAFFVAYYAGQGGLGAPSASTSTTIANSNAGSVNFTKIESEVIPSQGFVLPAKWGDSIKRLVDAGALNVSYLNYSLSRGGQPLTAEEKGILNGTSGDNITINSSDTGFVLYVLWALGINNNNPVLTNGPLMSYSSPYNLASTGGYGPLGTLQLDKLHILNMTPAEQEAVNYTAMSSYRPCCDNPTAMPDCNHGAAALGLIEIMASQGANRIAIFNALKKFSSFEFPQQYLSLAVYLQARGSDFNAVPSSLMMSANASSATAASSIQNYINSKGLIPQASGGRGCGA